MRYLTMTTLACCLASAGCSGDDSLTQAEAGRAFGSTSLALAGAHQAASEASVDGNQISVVAQCTDGGTASVEGTFDSGEFALAIDLDRCSEGGITIDGSVTYEGIIAPDLVNTTISGTLTYSGEIEATCDIEVTSSAGIAGGSIEGSICGQQLSASASAQ